MGHFIYYLPKRRNANALTIKEVGLQAVIPGRFAQRSLQRGPDEDCGMLVSNNTDVQLLYEAEAQDWRCCDEGRFWLGLVKDGPRPGPDQLVREHMNLRGYKVRLADGNDWIIPGCNPVMPVPTLPHRRRLQPSGDRVAEILPEFEGFNAKAVKTWQAFMAVKGDIGKFMVEMPENEQWELAEEAIAVGYRISKWEIDALELLDSTNAGNVIMAVLDFETLVEITKARDDAAKKNNGAGTRDGSPIAPGVTA